MPDPTADRPAMPDARALACPKCHAAMEQGFMLDNSHGAIAKPEWASGPIEQSWWAGVKTRGRERLVVETYRCTSCGFLESYARGA